MNLSLSRLSVLILSIAALGFSASDSAAATSAFENMNTGTQPDIAVYDANLTVHGSGVAQRFRAAADSFNLYGGVRSDGTNDRRPEGQFQTLGLAPDWQGWVGVDLTENPVFWHVDTFNAANLSATPSNHAIWSGVDASAQGFVSAPGYGNNWNDPMIWRGTTNPALFTSVRLKFEYNHDTEPGYDYFIVEYDSAGTWIEWTAVDGSNRDTSGAFTTPASFDQTILYTPLMYSGAGNTEVNLRLRVVSDGAWSDQDGLFPSKGAAQVDEIQVFFDGVPVSLTGDDGLATFEDLGGGVDDTEGWTPVSSVFAGDFAKILPNLEDIDPCRYNLGPQLGFVDDGSVPSNAIVSTGGSSSSNWAYGVVGNWVVNYTGGVSFGAVSVSNEGWSPEIPWNDPGSIEDDGLIGGAFIRFTVWQHLPLSNGIFWVWSVRSREAGQWSAWQNRNFVYYGGGIGGYITVQNDVSDLLQPNRDTVQLALGVTDLADVFGFPGNDATPSPAFDNVSFWRYNLGGPAFATRNIDLFQDAFPQSGTMDPAGSPLDLAVRVDMARDISTGALNAPGDSIVVDVTPSVAGTQLAGMPEMKWILEANPAFDGIRTLPAGAVNEGAGPNGRIRWSGTAPGDSARTSSGVAVADKFFFDMPNEGPALTAYQTSEPAMFFPGDRIRYYLEATDTGGGITTLPADTTGFYGTTEYNRLFTVRALPSLVENTGVWSQPEILMINDFGHRGGENDFISAFAQNGMFEGEDYDTYTVRGPSSMVSNGIGSSGAHGASTVQIGGYDKLFYVSGNLSAGLLSDGSNAGGNDKGNDIDLLTAWYDLPGDRHAAFFGDNLVSWLGGGGLNGSTFLSNELGAVLLDNDVSDEIDGQTAPLVRGAVVPFVTDIVAYGGCPAINQIDSIQPIAGAIESHSFVASDGTTPYTSAASVYYERLEGIDRRVAITFPYGFAYVFNPITNRTNVNTSARTKLVEEILAAFGSGTNSANATGVTTPTKRLAVAQNIPNPFNPKTTITFFAPTDGEVTVRVFNLKGELVRELLKGRVASGDNSVHWDGTDDRGARVSSGVYLYEVSGFGDRFTKKMALVK